MATRQGILIPRAIAAASQVSAPDILAPPTVPSAYDDEFATSTLKSIWTQSATPGSGFTTEYNAEGTFLRLKSPGAASNNVLTIRQPIGSEGTAGTAITVVSRFLLTAYSGASNIYSQLVVADSDSSNYFAFALAENSGNYRLWVYEWPANTFQYQQDIGRMSNEVWFLYQRDASNVVRLYASQNGRSWRRLYSATKTYNVARVAISHVGHTSSGNASTHMADFVRVNDSRFTQFTA